MEWKRVVDHERKGWRLDRFWGAELSDEGVSREKAKALIKDGFARVNGDAASDPRTKVFPGQELVLRLEDEPSKSPIEPVPGDLRVVYEDSDLVVVNKPAGLTVHPAPSVREPTLVHHLAHRHPQILSMDSERPGIVHRLDKETSGLMVCALNEKTRLALSRAFAERETTKRYLAVVLGAPEPASGEIRLPVGRHPTVKTKMAVVKKGGREALSDYRVLWTAPGGSASLVLVEIHTGRTHQIRVHMAALKHPLAGDSVYGRGADGTGAERTLLHAAHLAFVHPSTGKRLTFFAPPPEDFAKTLAGLNTRTFRVGVTGMPGCGKSLLLKYLADQGAPVFSADDAVARLYAADGDGARMLSARFGPSVLDESGAVDKRGLFARMVESDALRREVESMVHPMVFHALEEFWRMHPEAVFAAAEIPLLAETGRTERFDLIVGVDCPEALRTRLLKGRGVSDGVRAALESWQYPRADKLAVCQRIVPNDGAPEDLEQRAKSLVGDIVQIADKRNAAFLERLDELYAEADEGGQ